MHAVLVHGGDVALWFNDSTGVFAGKGDEENDDVEVTRAAQDTRPLGLKNCDNKTIAGTVNMVVKPALAEGAIWLQRGFVPGRQLIRKVLHIDTAARIAASRAPGTLRLPNSARAATASAKTAATWLHGEHALNCSYSWICMGPALRRGRGEGMDKAFESARRRRRPQPDEGRD